LGWVTRMFSSQSRDPPSMSPRVKVKASNAERDNLHVLLRHRPPEYLATRAGAENKGATLPCVYRQEDDQHAGASGPPIVFYTDTRMGPGHAYGEGDDADDGPSRRRFPRLTRNPAADQGRTQFTCASG
jgi:hypothetical protein